jgi:hypothetical protein
MHLGSWILHHNLAGQTPAVQKLGDSEWRDAKYVKTITINLLKLLWPTNLTHLTVLNVQFMLLHRYAHIADAKLWDTALKAHLTSFVV